MPTYIWYEQTWFRLAGGVMAGILGFTAIGTGAYAYSNPEITEGTTLYPVKQAIEKVEERIKITQEGKAKFYIKKMERREAEREVLEIRSEDEIINITTTTVKIEKKEKIKKTDSEIDKVEKELVKMKSELDEERDKKLKEKIEERLKKHQEWEKKRAEKQREAEKKELDRLEEREKISSEGRGSGRSDDSDEEEDDD